MAGEKMNHAEMGQAGEEAMPLRFLAAANARDWDGLERCLAAGMHVDAPYKGVAMLHVAAIHGDKEMASWLLDRGASLESRMRTPGWLTPLMLCVRGDAGHVPGVAAPPTDEGEKALGRLEVMADLIARGADVEARLPNGSTALMFACVVGDGKRVEMLLAAGAAPLVKMALGVHEVDAAGAAGMLGHAALAARLKDFALAVEEKEALTDSSKAAGVAPGSKAAPSL